MENVQMHVVACTVRLHLPVTGSLKAKRSIIKPLLTRMQRKFIVSAAETGSNDVHRAAELSIAKVGNEPGHLHSCMEEIVHWLERERPDLDIVEYRIEFR